MDYTPENATAILKVVEDALKWSDPPATRLTKIWWTLLSSRSHVLTGGLLQLTGNKVHGGPFKGTLLTNEAIKAYRSTILLGCYEHELHPIFEKVIATNYTRILNIGCSVGYYAVGLAKRMPNVIVEAFDIDPQARLKCAGMIELNKVGNQVRISGEFSGSYFTKYADQKTLVLMDVEGAETTLLDPALYPALLKMDVIVELHDVMDPTISKKVSDRFKGSHQIEIVKNRNFLPDLGDLLPSDRHLDPFDQLLLGWEGRDGLTPWGIYWSNS